MDKYFTSIALLGLHDQNLPLFKDVRLKRLASIEKMNRLVTMVPRMIPKIPDTAFHLDPNDPEWDDKMIYPVINWHRHCYQIGYWAFFTFFCSYNWNVLHGNRRFRHFTNAYPFFSAWFLYEIYYQYRKELTQINLFENYTETRALELFNQNKYLLKHEHMKRFVYFHEDLQESMKRVHRQANNHSAEDFKDSELLLQDFIRRYSDPKNPDSAIFRETGKFKMLN